MSDQTAEAPAGFQSRPTCYNCGSADHYLTACPEPTRAIPAGLAAAKAAEANKGPQKNTGGYLPPNDRPSKRPRVGGGAVVTYYGPPPTSRPMTQPFVPAPSGPFVPNQGYYPNAAQQYPAPHPQQYGQPMQPPPQGPPQQAGPYPPYGYPQQANQMGVYPQHVQMQNGYGPYGGAPAPVPQAYPYGQAAQPSYEQSYGQNQAYPQGQPYGQNQIQYGQTQPFGPQQPPVNNQPYGQPAPSYGPAASPQQFGQFPTQSYGPPAGSAPHQPYQAPIGPQQGFHYNAQQPQQWTPPQMTNTGQGQHQTFNQNFTSKKRPSFNNPNKERPSSFAPVKHHYGLPPGDRPADLPAKPTGADTSNHSNQFVAEGNNENEQAHGNNTIDENDSSEEIDFHFGSANYFNFFHRNSCKHDEPIRILHPIPAIQDDKPIIRAVDEAQSVSSKYARPTNLEVYMLPANKTLRWGTLRHDPVFKEIDVDSPSIPIEELGHWLQEREKNQLAAAVQYDRLPATISLPQEESYDPPIKNEQHIQQEHEQALCIKQEFNRDDYHSGHSPAAQSQLQSPVDMSVSSPTQGSQRPKSRVCTPSLEAQGTPGTGSADDAWAPQPGESQVAREEYKDPTEALLASLGVTGSPKPICDDNTMSIDPLAEPYDPYNKRGRQDSGYVSAHPSHSRDDYFANHWNGSIHPPPPPPPRPPRLPKSRQSSIESPHSDNNEDHAKYERRGSHPENNTSNGMETFEGDSPLTPTEAELLGHVPFAPDENRDRKSEQMRQIDDVTPKFRRRQPRVEPAYSRRW